ncbi:MAG: hypothetical protein H8E74_07285 [Gammaproteobacteria bacterium]|nr:hypothetical protein [Gammaproteobacteria bacterium]
MISQLGSSVLAAIGIANVITFLPITLFLGLSYGIQTLTAREYGKQSIQINTALNTGIICLLLLSLSTAALISCFPQSLYSLITQNQQVCSLGKNYLIMRGLGLIFLSITLGMRAYFQSICKTHFPPLIIACAVTINTILNIILIYFTNYNNNEKLLGIGITNTIALLFAALTYSYLFIRHNKTFNICLSLTRSNLKKLLTLSFPISMHGIADHLATILLYRMIGTLGVTAIAATHITFNILGTSPGMGFGLTALSMVSQAIGADNIKQAKQYGYQVALLGGITLGIIGLLGYILSPSLLTTFILDKPLLQTTMTPVKIMCLYLSVHVGSQIMHKCFEGASAITHIITTNLSVLYGFLLPASFIAIFYFNCNINTVWILLALEKLLKLLLLIYQWQQEIWIKGSQREPIIPSQQPKILPTA